MDDEKSLITQPRDYSEICRLSDHAILEDFLNEPLTFIAETITGALAVAFGHDENRRTSQILFPEQ